MANVRLNSIPTVLSVEKDWGAHVKVGSSWESHVVVGIDAGQSQVAEWTGEEFTDQIIVDVISATDVDARQDAQGVLNLFEETTDAGVMSGSGVLEHYSVAGVTLNAAPIQDQYVTWGHAGQTQEVTHYGSTYGGTDKFGDPRKVALRQLGLLWLKFSGSTAPTIGHYVQPSDGIDGQAEVCPSGSASVAMTYGKVYGYASGSNLGGVTSSGTVTGAQFVLVDFSRGNW